MVLKRGFLRRAALISSAVGVVCAFLYSSFDASLLRQKVNFEADAHAVVSTFRSAMDVVDGVATSVSALQGYRSGNSAQDSIAKTLTANYSFVQGFGRFDSVSVENLPQYSRTLELADSSGVPAVWWFDEAGNQITHGTDIRGLPSSAGSQQFYPVTLNLGAEAKNKHISAMTGFDLAADAVLARAIQHSTETGKTVITSAPSTWSNSDSVFAIRSLYHNGGVPKSVRDRKAMMDGGYWLEINFNELDLPTEMLDEVGVTLSLIESESEYTMDNATQLYSRALPDTELLFSRSLVASEWLSSFHVGNQTFTIRVAQQRGLTISAFLSWLLVAAGILSLLGVIVALNAKRHRAVKKQRQQSERLFREQQRASVTLSSIGDAVISVDANGNIQYANRAAEHMLEMQSDNVIGLPIQSIFRSTETEQSDSRKVSHDENYYLTDKVASCDKDLLRVDGREIAVNETVSPVRDVDGSRDGSVIVLRDITAERELTKQLEYQINHDSLTGLANRYNFETRLGDLVAENADAGPGHALCMIDLDKFKKVNDTCGHAAGDRLLKELSAALQVRVRAEDQLARLGGDEFAIILEGCTLESATGVADRIHRFFNTYHFEFENKVFPVRASIGLVHFGAGESDLEKVVSAADSACYEAKNKGRNAVHIYASEEIERLDNSSEELWLPRIERALEQGHFTLNAQPICALVDSSSDCPSHHELLIRMLDPERSNQVYFPRQFMKSAERYGLSGQIDQWVVRSSIKLISGLPAQMDSDTFSINLCATTLVNDEFAAFVADELKRFGVAGSRLCFDITEESVLNNMDAASTTVGNLKKLGCSIALDDFGAGMSSMSALRELRIDYLKIDGQFIANLENSYVDESMVRSINSFAQAMGLRTIAEQVETKAAQTILSNIGVDYIQGYVIAKPCPIEEYIQSCCRQLGLKVA